MSEARDKEIDRAKMLDLGKNPIITVLVFCSIAIIPVVLVIGLAEILIKLLVG